MYIAEWSVVKDIGEAKLYPFFFFPIQETVNLSRVIPPSLRGYKKSANWSTESMLLWDRDCCGENSSTNYTCFSERLFLAEPFQILRSLKWILREKGEYLRSQETFTTKSPLVSSTTAVNILLSVSFDKATTLNFLRKIFNIYITWY